MAVKCATTVSAALREVPTTVAVQQTAAVLKLIADASESNTPRATEPRSAATETSHEGTEREESDSGPSGASSEDVVDEVAEGDEVQRVRRKRRERDEADEQQRESDARLEERQQVAVEAMEHEEVDGDTGR
ncbi:hypothetical protein PF011_g32462 [Phytophthora fragariae]|uniref:Uncharacterized protein n=1 Tax=Phytophthora fragariae TaxID=53985 RepID=A0A6A3GHH4_9STRA|nr:hypothetical protein PF011_g32462 [Phytophthora fragariae]